MGWWARRRKRYSNRFLLIPRVIAGKRENIILYELGYVRCVNICKWGLAATGMEMGMGKDACVSDRMYANII